MIRNMEKTAKKAESNVPVLYDLSFSEITELYRVIESGSKEKALDAILIAFKYGFVMGHRATLAGKVTKNSEIRRRKHI